MKNNVLSHLLLNAICIGFSLSLVAVTPSAYAEDRKNCSQTPVEPKPTPEMIQAAMKSAADRGFLWRIVKDNRTSYLYGTIHVAKFDWMFPGPKVIQAIQATDTLALELDFLDTSIQERMIKGMSAQSGATLPEPLVKRMRQVADSECIPYDSIANLIPELQITMLALMMGRSEGLDAAYAIDSVLSGIGHGAKKTVVSLETPESQLKTLQMKNANETIAFVQSGLDDIEAGRAHGMLTRIAKVWANADYADMAHFNEWCECLDTEVERNMMKRMLDDRNPALADQINTMHRSGKQVFAAVGSLHMFGPVGLPALMEKHGYRVERVNLNSLSD